LVNIETIVEVQKKIYIEILILKKLQSSLNITLPPNIGEEGEEVTGEEEEVMCEEEELEGSLTTIEKINIIYLRLTSLIDLRYQLEVNGTILLQNKLNKVSQLESSNNEENYEIEIVELIKEIKIQYIRITILKTLNDIQVI
jgi:hypothetical protein